MGSLDIIIDVLFISTNKTIIEDILLLWGFLFSETSKSVDDYTGHDVQHNLTESYVTNVVEEKSSQAVLLWDILISREACDRTTYGSSDHGIYVV